MLFSSRRCHVDVPETNDRSYDVAFRKTAGSRRRRLVMSREGDVPEIMADVDANTLLGKIIAASPDVVVVVDQLYRIVFSSPAAVELFGYSPDELIGQPLELLIPDGRRDRHLGHLEQYFEDPHPREMGVGLDLAARRRDGTELPIDVSLTPVLLGGVTFVAAFVRDATERRRELDRLHAMNEITKRLLAGEQVRQILPLVARSARLLCSSDAAWIVMPASTEMEIVSVDGSGTERLLGVTLSADTSRSAEAMRSGISDVIPDLSSANNVPDGVIDLDLGPGLYVPFIANDRRLGTLVMGRRRGRPSYQPIDVAFAEVFAGAAATAIEMGSVRLEIDRLNIVAEDERIARDLHDSVIQELFALGMSLQAAGSSLTGPIGDRISTVVEGLDDVISQIRHTTFHSPGRSEVPSGLREEMLRLADKYHHDLAVLPRIAF